MKSSEIWPSTQALEPTARERWPETFGGVWGEETDDGVVTSISIAFTEGTEEKVAELAVDFPAPELLQGVTVDDSIKELEAQQKQMIVDRERAKQGEIALAGVADGDYDLEIDVKQNALVATVGAASSKVEATESFKSRYSDDVMVRQGQLAKPHACTRIDCRYNLRSGLRLDDPNPGCSSAFTVVSPVTGMRNLLSAAHCGNSGSGCGSGDVGTQRYHGGEYYGNNRAEQCQGWVDAERSGPPQGSFVMVPYTYVNANQQAVPVKWRSSWAGIVVGFNACKSSVVTGLRCGEMLGKWYSPSYVPNGNRFIKAAYCGYFGDSGGGVFMQSENRRVHGIHSGGTSLPNQCQNWNPPGHFTIFGHVEYALNALNVNLVTVP